MKQITKKKTKTQIEEDYKFNCRKVILELEHELKMTRLKYQRASDDHFHQLALERERIKSAEIRKSQMRRHEGFKY